MAFFNKTTQMASDAVIERPRLPTAPSRLTPRIDREVMDEASLAEYRQVAAEVGVSDTDLLVEEFRLFLARSDIPTFNFIEVAAYMDEIAARDNPTGLGWHWCPVRDKDAAVKMTFGRGSHEDYRNRPVVRVAASDFYASHRRDAGGGHYTEARSSSYSRTIPLHALKKIALIERGFGVDKAVFLVTDYTIKPDVVVTPDPFLMAVLPNSAVAQGKGRFIIDVWDEPGFGIERMVK